MTIGIRPPFLELSYYLAQDDMEVAMRTLFGRSSNDAVVFNVANAVGIGESGEQVVCRDGFLILRTEGGSFCGTERLDYTRLRKLGAIVYKRFVDVALRIHPHYGAILGEYSLETPAELVKAKSLAFRNFFIGSEFFDPPTISKIIGAAGNRAYTNSTANGVYVSMSPEFNPAGMSVPVDDALWRSARIGSIIGEVLGEDQRRQ